MNTFGIRFRIVLNKSNLKGYQIAELTGKSKQTISGYISERAEPDLHFLKKLRELIPLLDLNWLITGEGNMFINEDSGEGVGELKTKVGELEVRERQLTDTIIRMGSLIGKPLAKNKGVYVPANFMLHNNRLWFGTQHTVNYTPQFAH